MAKAKQGDTVKVHYTGKLADETQFDSSRGREPLEFELGAGNVIPGFEKAIEGMDVGETKQVHIPADEAYGPRREELLIDVERSNLPEGMSPEVGQRLQMQRTDGQTVIVSVSAVDENQITVDANHPLAGRDLFFDIELVEIG